MSKPDNTKTLTIDITLDFPIKIAGNEVKLLTLRRPKVAVIEILEAMEIM